jgi:spermidine/putrescine transport system ATP-binding protein
MSDRIAVMSDGRVLQVGTPTEIYERPNCRFVADFIGESNFIKGRVSAVNSGDVAITTGDGLTVRGQMVQPLRVGDEAFVSVRPEKARLSVQPPGDGAANMFSVAVDRVAYIGSDTRIMVQLGSDRLFNVWEQNVRSTVDRDAYWQRGEKGYLWWPIENALVLTE